jgi:glucokinase
MAPDTMKLPANTREGGFGWDEFNGATAPGRPKMLREVNARRVLTLLRQQGPCSRADLARISGLSAPTISSGVAYLDKRRLIESMGLGSSNGGRPPKLLRFNAQAGYVAGADVGTSLVRVALADLNGTLIGEWQASTKNHTRPERVSSLIADSIRKLQERHKIRPKRLLTLAAGVPGITDTRAGVVLSAPNLSSGWRSIPLRQMLEKETGIPTVVENDVNLAAIGESWRGTAQGVANFVFLTIGTGVGAGIFVDGRLYRGADWAAGEIGYLYVPGTAETPLAIRRPGSLEESIAEGGIRRAWQRLTNGNRRHNIPAERELAATEILDLAERDDRRARAVLQRTARILADAITNVCVILNCSLVVFGGRVGSNAALFEATRRIVQRNEYYRPRLALSALGPKAPLQGAIWLALAGAEDHLLPSAFAAPLTSAHGTYPGLLRGTALQAEQSRTAGASAAGSSETS